MHSSIPQSLNTPYLNSIAGGGEPDYPGDLDLEERLEATIRWNAVAMVVHANHKHPGLGGHLSTYASAATLYEVGFNHFFRGGGAGEADMVYFQGHASPGVYARAFVEGHFDEDQLKHFRRESGEPDGLSSYPHPHLMPNFWQFPTVSMGLGPLLSVYQARFSRYAAARGLCEDGQRVWAFVGDGEMDEPESTAGLALAAREKLDNLTWVVNCNLQRLDGPVRGNAKIIQEFERIFTGAGWNVIKVIWGSGWDALLEKDGEGVLRERMEEMLDGDYQRLSAASGAEVRRDFFGSNDKLKDLVAHLTDDELAGLMRGGHDPRKIHAAYKAATEHRGRPTVILVKTVKGFGLGESGEGLNITHQQKKLDEKGLREFRDRFDIPVGDDAIAETPFYRPPEESDELQYLHQRRKALGGYLPRRSSKSETLDIPKLGAFSKITQGGDKEASSTMAFVRLLEMLMSDEGIGERIVPIIPDEARTFGVDALFRKFSIYAADGQQYEPVDKDQLLYYREEEDGQILEEGITEAGAMGSFIAAGTAESTRGVATVPFYMFYSMFGFQRVGDFIWAAGDSLTKGFLLGCTAGRTTLNGEGLQHQDGHSHLLAGAYPSIVAYDPAFAYEVAVIVQHGLERMYRWDEPVMHYLTLYNESYPMPDMPAGCSEGIIRGLYCFRSGPEAKSKAHVLASGPLVMEALKAQEVLAQEHDVSLDVWSATSYKCLREDALEKEAWNRKHPDENPKVPHVVELLGDVQGPVIAVSDQVSLVPAQIEAWVPGRLRVLGTDGYGRSDTRENLRRFFGIDADSIVSAVRHQLDKPDKGESS
ncbi:MAG: pyruvate dehydrogenase (acetyl-transferring), homodimeric type [Akkermansiaceae bacterium]|nr:pyruvate dehydrogenase (acetyl-transferring), homodimeric type [Akkermansiaceae bacterium]